jgi:hypothetical protein
MSEPVYRLGDAVRTPSNGVGVVVTINRGPIRGRNWREVSYTVKAENSPQTAVYYESELTRSSGR